MQLGFGWGKGRRVIKTVIAGEALTRALAKPQAWVDAQTHQPADVAYLEAHRRDRAAALVTLTREHAILRARLRMAKASLRP